jgi:hypothetical protein
MLGGLGEEDRRGRGGDSQSQHDGETKPHHSWPV